MKQQEPCTIILQETQFYEDGPGPSRGDTAGGRRLKNASKTKEKKEWVCQLSEADAAAAKATMVTIDGITPDFIKAYGIESAQNTIMVQEESIESNRMYVQNTATIIVGDSEQKKAKAAESENGGRKLAAAPRKVLVVRVNNSSDGRKTSASASQLTNDIFDDAVSLKSQYAACSYGELTFDKATGSNVVGGVVSVDLNSKVNGVSSDTVRDQMKAAADSKIGTNVQTAYNHVMFCLPPGTVDGGSSGW